MLKVLTKGCKPTKGSKYSAGIDLYASEDVIIGTGETKLVGLGVCIDLEKLLYRVPKIVDMRRWHKKRFDAGITDVSEDESISHLENEFLSSHYLELQLQDNITSKGLMSNTCIIKLDYEDEIKIIIHNPLNGIANFDNTNRGAMNQRYFTIKKGDKIAQILLKKHKSYLFGVESDDERTGGFGSTDGK